MDRPYRPCKRCGCPNLTRNKSGYCDGHQSIYEQERAQANRYYEKSRGSASSQGYGKDWESVRFLYLSQHPLCEDCLEQDIVTVATLVHHIKPVRDYPELRLDTDNLRALCGACHEKIHGKKRWKERSV